MKIVLCGNDISSYSLVLPEKPEPAEVTAAEYIARVVKASCGAELPITSVPSGHSIFVGGTQDISGIRYDGFKIITGADDAWLYGAMPRGTLYAAYEFAERFLGCRNYAPDTEVIPAQGEARIPSHYSRIDNPGFELRANDWISNSAFPEFASHNRMNSIYSASDEKYGGIIKNLGGCHTFERLCPPSEHFAEHPEYYSMWEGKRIPAGNVFDRECGQLCLTNPDVLAIVTENLLKSLREHPDTRIVELSQNDNGRYCHCEKCAAVDAEEGSPSGLMLRFVNTVAEAVEKEFPNVLVQTFAYQYTRKAPKITRPRSNVMIRYCTIEACFRHPLDDEGCERNAGKFARELSEWRAICDKISVWDYVTNYSCYLAPFPNFDILAKNIRFFADSHAVHLFEEDTPGTYSGDLGDLKAYLLSKLMWKPHMLRADIDECIDGFLEAYYGPGWQSVRRYMRILSDVTRNRHMGCFERMDRGFLGSDPESEKYEPQPYQEIAEDSYLSDAIPRLGELDRLWETVEKLAGNDVQRMHARRSRMSVTYMRLFCTPHDREAMSEAERAAYEAEVEKYRADKLAFGFNTNIWTARAGR